MEETVTKLETKELVITMDKIDNAEELLKVFKAINFTLTLTVSEDTLKENEVLNKFIK